MDERTGDDDETEDGSDRGGRTVEDIEREMARINDRMTDIRAELDRWETSGDPGPAREDSENSIDDLADRLERWETGDDTDPEADSREAGGEAGESDSDGT